MSVSIKELYAKFLKHPAICTDSRRIVENSIFFALKGENFDGNEYASQAIADGSVYAVIDAVDKADGDKYLIVDNVLEVLQQLATYHREQLSIPVVCITGTNGKTTTKELLAAILSKKLNVVATKGNFNNHIGVPLSLLTINADTEIAIIELGANHIGEIDFLCGIAKPTYGLITNIGKAHLEGFGSIDGVKQAKSELYKYLKANEGQVFVNSDNEILMNLSVGMNTVLYGSSKDNDCVGSFTDEGSHLKIGFTHGDESMLHEISSTLFGKYNYENILAAICIGSFFQVPEADIVEAVESYIPDNNRSQKKDTGRNRLIIDTYNANPTSMLAALESFSDLAGSNQMVILGDMLEAGDFVEEEHKSIIEYLRAHSFERVLLVGEEFSKVFDMLRCEHFKNVDDAKTWLRSSPPSDMNILIKGSRGIGLEALLDVL